MNKIKQLFTKEGISAALKWFYKSLIWLMILLFVADIVTKWIAQANIPYGGRVIVIENVFELTLQYNEGASWSLLDNARWLWIIVSVVMSTILIFIYIKKFKSMNGWYKAGLCLMIPGALGNLIDRAFYWEGTVGFNGVIDFIRLFPKVFSPTFNFADTSLVAGALVLLVAVIIDMVKEAKEKAARGEYKFSPKELEARQKEQEQNSVNENKENKEHE